MQEEMRKNKFFALNLYLLSNNVSLKAMLLHCTGTN